MKCWFLCVALSYFYFSEVALAKCTAERGVYDYNIGSFPSEIRLPLVPVGGVFAVSEWYSVIGVGASCSEGDVVSFSAESGMELSSYPNVYKTNVEGIGVRFKISNGIDKRYVPSVYVIPKSGWNSPWYFSYHNSGTMELVRIGAGVGGGRLDMNVKFSARAPGLREFFYTGKISTVIGNNVYMMCSLTNSKLNVPMGRFYVGEVKSNIATEKLFSFNVQCVGLPASKRPPVKVYFLGDSPADGSLNLSGVGSSNVASGVKISLVSDKGIKLPFSLTNALKLDWQRSEGAREIYGFSGKAKYVPTGGVIKPGAADAVMNIVLDYD